MTLHTTVHLSLHGIAEEWKIQRLSFALSEDYGIEMKDFETTFLTPGLSLILPIEDVDRDDFEMNFLSIAEEIEISYIWSWCEFEGGAAGLGIYDARTGVAQTFPAVDREIAILAKDLNDPFEIERVRDAQKLHDLLSPVGLRAADTAHEKMQILSSDPHFRAYYQKGAKN